MDQYEAIDNRHRTILYRNPQFWSILSIFILITLHYYDNLTSFRLFSTPDLPLGITRHTIDRILYLVPIILSSVAFGSRGGNITLAVAVIAMVPRSIFISESPITAMWETLLVTLIGSLVPIGLDNYRKQERQLEATSERLQVSEERYRQLFESAHDAIWVQDLSNRITAANQAAADLLACPLPELIGADIMQFMPKGDTVFIKDGNREAAEGTAKGDIEQEPYKRKIIRRDGAEAFVMLTSNVISSNDMPDGIQFIGRDITKEVRMQENQSYYLQKITNAHEEERQRISRDLHDSTAQNLIAALRLLENFSEVNTQLSSEKQEFLWRLHGHLKSTLQEIRQLSRDLRPSVLDNLGLMPAVEWLVEQLESERGIKATLTVTGTEKRFAPEIEVALFRVIQEALRNIVKHSGAGCATVALSFKEGETGVIITDDGRGFELPTSLGEFSRQGKLGIDGMQTRVRLAGGTFDVKTRPDKGTVISIVLPI